MPSNKVVKRGKFAGSRYADSSQASSRRKDRGDGEHSDINPFLVTGSLSYVAANSKQSCCELFCGDSAEKL
jgi:hypothetical protein